MSTIYLDNAATTPADPAVVNAMQPYFSELYGNPLSHHDFALDAEKAVTRARKTVASLIGARPREVVFTSGGSESNNTALKGIAYAYRDRGDHIITSVIEHDSVRSPCTFLEQEGFTVTRVAVDRQGLVDPDDIAQAIGKRTILISIMHANNEIGTIQPIAEIGKLARKHGIAFHSDAVQTFAHLPIDVDALRVDLLSVSGHKAYGPKGVGLLYVRDGTRIVPLLHGGAHEAGRRASTHNVPGIVGLGVAAEIARRAMSAEADRISALQRTLIDGILERIGGATLNGHPSRRLAGNVNISFPHARGDLLLKQLARHGIACSTGSTCRESATEPSHVLAAIGLPDELRMGSLRFSLGRWVTREDIDHLLEILPRLTGQARSLSEFLD